MPQKATETQVAIVQQACRYIKSHLEEPLTLATLAAQTTPPAGGPPAGAGRGRGGGRGAMGSPATALRSPEVNPDRTVTFRFRAAGGRDSH